MLDCNLRPLLPLNLVLHLTIQLELCDRQAPAVEQGYLDRAGDNGVVSGGEQVFRRAIGAAEAMQYNPWLLLSQRLVGEEGSGFEYERDFKLFLLIGPGTPIDQLHIDGEEILFARFGDARIADDRF